MSNFKILDEITPAQRKALAGGKTPEIRKSSLKGSNIPDWSISKLQRELWRTYNVVKNGLAGEKNAVLVFGDQGSGKSEVVQSFAKSLSREFPNRKYLHFTDLANFEKTKELIDDPSKYFVFLDLRASQLAEHQVGGVPNMPRSDVAGFLVWSPTDWTALVTNPEFAGYIFLDEVNRADPAVINSLFGLVLDRMISGRRLSKNCYIAAAANLGSKFAGTTELDPAFFGRFNVGNLIPSADEWAVWAQKNGIDQSIIDFVMLDPKKNFIRNYGANQQTVNPRNLQKASDNLKWMHYVYDNAIAAAAKDGITQPTAKQLVPYLNKYNVPGTDISAMTGDVYADYYDSIVTRCGTDWTNDFMQYLRNVDEFEWEDVIQKFEQGVWKQKSGKKAADELETGKLYYVVRYVVDNLVGRWDAAMQKNDQAAKQKVSNDLAIALNGLDPDQISIVLDRMLAYVKSKHTDPVKGPPGVANEMGELFAPVHAILSQRGNNEAKKKIGEWIARNKATGANRSITETIQPKNDFRRLLQNTSTSYKPKFKTFYNSR